jgi:hypothetical protein
MELTPVQRVLAFLGIVVVLGGTGAYLLIPGVRAALGQGPHPAATPRATASQPAGAPPATAAPAASSAAPPTASAAATPDIYGWLPFSPADLAHASRVTVAFGAAYGTWSYTESARSYQASLGGVATSQLAATVARGWALPSLASQRTHQHQVATARAAIDSLRAFGPSSLTFVVTIDQTVRSNQGTSQPTGQYAVTVVNNGGTWLVNDIELSSAGNS